MFFVASLTLNRVVLILFIFPMVEHEQRRISHKETDTSNPSSLMEAMKANAQSSIFPEIRAVLEQREEQAKEAKPNVDVPGFAHVDDAVARILTFEDPEVTEARITSSLLQSPLPSEAESKDGIVNQGPMDVMDDRVQQRIDHIFALAGAARHPYALEDSNQLIVNVTSKTKLAPDILLVEERSIRSVALRFERVPK